MPNPAVHADADFYVSAKPMHTPPRDKTGKLVHVGSRVRLLSLSGNWLEELPHEEKQDALSMIGEIFEVEEIDEYGHPWVQKSWPMKLRESATHIQSLSDRTKWSWSMKKRSNIA